MKKDITLQTDYMKENQFKIGDTITIHKKPDLWSSHFVDNNPLGLEYPWTGTIEDIGDPPSGLAGLISGYGFYMESIEIYTLNSNTYEIY